MSNKDNNFTVYGSYWTIDTEETQPIHGLNKVRILISKTHASGNKEVLRFYEKHDRLVLAFRTLADQIEGWTKQNVQAIDPKDKVQRACPRCFSQSYERERRPDGYTICQNCGLKLKSTEWDA